MLRAWLKSCLVLSRRPEKEAILADYYLHACCLSNKTISISTDFQSHNKETVQQRNCWNTKIRSKILFQYTQSYINKGVDELHCHNCYFCVWVSYKPRRRRNTVSYRCTDFRQISHRALPHSEMVRVLWFLISVISVRGLAVFKGLLLQRVQHVSRHRICITPYAICTNTKMLHGPLILASTIGILPTRLFCTVHSLSYSYVSFIALKHQR